MATSESQRHPRDPVAEALVAAIAALRSYQYGNSSPGLAKRTADAGVAAMREVGCGAMLLGMDRS